MTLYTVLEERVSNAIKTRGIQVCILICQSTLKLEIVITVTVV
jgi:hypothetical protein